MFTAKLDRGFAVAMTAGRNGTLRFVQRPSTPWGMNRITKISTKPSTTLPAIALSAEVKPNSNAVIATAPTAGPAQCRDPPSTAINTTVSGSVMPKVSAVVT